MKEGDVVFWFIDENQWGIGEYSLKTFGKDCPVIIAEEPNDDLNRNKECPYCHKKPPEIIYWDGYPRNFEFLTKIGTLKD